ncbi:hypothetical protein I4U23_000859 [Adineta vaga]|nr:hypothetical protein I4U23_000859 [Adineta vaga]
MITETRQSRTRLLQYYERRSRRRHHTLDNATLDKFNFICVPLRLDERHLEPSSSQTNLNVTSSKDIKICKPIEISSPTRRVRFQFDKNDKHERNFHSTDDERSPKKYSTHRVEFQIPLNKEINPWLNIDSPSPSAKVRSITSQKIDINHNNINNTIHPPSMTSYINLPSTDDPDRTRSQWYKEMYCHIHKPSEHKKDNLDVILVKLPLTPSRYREYHQKRDEQSNPYKPTYTFPDEFNGDLDRMEEYIRKTASHKSDSDRKNFSSSPIRMQTANVNDYPTNTKRNPEKITRFSDQLTFSSTSPTIERAKPINVTIASPVTVSSRSNTTHPIQPTSTTTTTTTDDEQKLMYKRVLRGGDIPATGLQKCLPHNRGKHMVLVFYQCE